MEVTSATGEESRLCLGWEGRPVTREKRRDDAMVLLIAAAVRFDMFSSSLSGLLYSHSLLLSFS